MNRLFKRLMFFSIACLIAAAPLQAAVVNWLIPSVNQDFNNSANWDGTVDAGAVLHVNTDAQFPIFNSGANQSVYGLYMDDTGSNSRLDITGKQLELGYYFQMGTSGLGTTTSTLNLDNATLNKGGVSYGYADPLNQRVMIGASSGATANINMTNGSVMNLNYTASINFGRNAGAACNITMANSTLTTAAGADASNWQWVAFIGRGGGTGVVSMTDSTWDHFGSSIQIGNGADGNGTLNVMGASTVRIKPQVDSSFSDGILFIAVGDAAAQGAVTLTGTSPTEIASIVMNTNGVVSCGNSGTGTLTLNQYSMIASAGMEFGVNGGTGTLTLNGGTLKALANEPDFLRTDSNFGTAYIEVCENGVTFEVGTDGGGAPLTIGTRMDLNHGGAPAIDGGLTKTGVGQFNLNGTAFYTGDTRVNEGTFAGYGSLWYSKIVLGSAGIVAPGDTTGNPENPYYMTAAGLDASAGGTIVNRIDCAGGLSNELQINGAAILTNTHFAPNFVNGAPSGSYRLLVASGGLTASGLVLDATAQIPNSRLVMELTYDSLAVYLNASGTPLSDVWTGAVSGVWDANGADNWANDGTDLKFMNLDSVTFDSTDSSPNITLDEHVYVPSMNVSGANNYVISGTGNITGVSAEAGAALTVDGPGSVDIQVSGNAFGPVNLNGGTTSFTNSANTAGVVLVGATSGAEATLTLNASSLNSNAYVEFGANGGSATATMSNHSSAYVSGGNGDTGNYGAIFEVGANPGAPSKLTLNDSTYTINGSSVVGVAGGDGTLELNGTSSFVVLGGAFWIGLDAGSKGAVTMTGGTAEQAGSQLAVLGTLSVANLEGETTFVMSDYTQVYAQDGAEFGKDGGYATLEMYGHSQMTTPMGDGLRIGQGGTAVATMNDSSKLITRYLQVGIWGGTGTFNLNGGTIQPTYPEANFIPMENGHVYICENGGTMLNYMDIGINVALEHGFVGGTDVPDGGLIKQGNGTLLLTVAPTYTGNTDIQSGTLQLAVPGDVVLTTITGSDTGTLSVCDGTTLTATSIQVGTLSIGGSPVVIGAVSVAVPEPSTLILLVLAGIGLLFQARRKARA